MKRPLTAVLIAAVAFAGLAVSNARPAMAGGSVHAGYSAHFGGYGHYGPRYHVGYRHGFHRRHYGHHRRHGGGAGDVLIGLGAGLLLYHVIDQANERRVEPGYGGYGDYGPVRRVYREAEPPRYAPRPGPAPARTAFEESQCRQTREYQTTITIGGEEKDAYGTACLQPDGSWLMGPPQPVPDFN